MNTVMSRCVTITVMFLILFFFLFREQKTAYGVRVGRGGVEVGRGGGEGVGRRDE